MRILEATDRQSNAFSGARTRSASGQARATSIKVDRHPAATPRPTATERANAPHAWVPVNGSDTSAILDWRARSGVLVRFRRLEDRAMRALLSTPGVCKSLIWPQEMWGYLRL